MSIINTNLNENSIAKLVENDSKMLMKMYGSESVKICKTITARSIEFRYIHSATQCKRDAVQANHYNQGEERELQKSVLTTRYKFAHLCT